MTRIPIIRWSDGTVLYRQQASSGEDRVAFSLRFPIPEEYQYRSAFSGWVDDIEALVTDAVILHDGWPLLAFSSSYCPTGSELLRFKNQDRDSIRARNKVMILRANRMYEAMSAMRILERTRPFELIGNEVLWSAKVDDGRERLTIWDCIGGVPAFPPLEPDGVTWEWACPELVGEVQALLGTSPPALLPWSDLVALVGAGE